MDASSVLKMPICFACVKESQVEAESSTLKTGREHALRAVLGTARVKNRTDRSIFESFGGTRSPTFHPHYVPVQHRLCLPALKSGSDTPLGFSKTMFHPPSSASQKSDRSVTCCSAWPVVTTLAQ
jgi:hypothetical protein